MIDSIMIGLMGDLFYTLSPWISYPLVIFGVLIGLIIIGGFITLFFWCLRLVFSIFEGALGILFKGY